jgi:hypothetical protein
LQRYSNATPKLSERDLLSGCDKPSSNVSDHIRAKRDPVSDAFCRKLLGAAASRKMTGWPGQPAASGGS